MRVRPTGRLSIFIVATPSTSVTLPIHRRDSSGRIRKNAMVPVGVPCPGVSERARAVKVTESPCTDGLPELTRSCVVVRAFVGARRLPCDAISR
jgi:hypothetical protein